MKWTKEACISGLRAAAVNGVVSYWQAASYEMSLPTMAKRRFGTFADACRAAGLCSATEAREQFTTCSVADCGQAVRSIGTPYCEMHYGRLRRHGTTDRLVPPDSRGHTQGYVLLYLPNHPLRQESSPYVYQHRAVFYENHGKGPFACHWCGKHLTWETMHVDHVNTIKDDNRPENLVPSCPICNQHRGRNKMIDTVRRKRGVWLEFQGQRKLQSDWAAEIGISRAALSFRLNAGWPIERALTEGRGKTGPKATNTTQRRR